MAQRNNVETFPGREIAHNIMQNRIVGVFSLALRNF